MYILLVLHMFLKEFKNTIPLISKMYFKDSFSQEAKGFDAVHVSQDSLTLWLGETNVSIAKPTSYIKALHIPIPPIELQQNWAVLVRATLAAVADNNLEMEKLTDFAQTLLSGLSR